MGRWSCTGGAEPLSSRRGKPRDSEHGDVIFLAEGLRGGGDTAGGLCADFTCALEAVELTLWIHGFHDTIGQQGQRFAWRKREVSLGVLNAPGDSQWKAGVGGNFFSAAIRRKVAGIGHGDGAV